MQLQEYTYYSDIAKGPESLKVINYDLEKSLKVLIFTPPQSVGTLGMVKIKKKKEQANWQLFNLTELLCLYCRVPGTIMVLVVLLSRKCHVNPDNVATPIAASLGDLITLSLLSGISYLIYKAIGEKGGTSHFTN